MLQSRISIKRKHTVKIIKGGVIIIIIQVKKNILCGLIFVWQISYINVNINLCEDLTHLRGQIIIDLNKVHVTHVTVKHVQQFSS